MNFGLSFFQRKPLEIVKSEPAVIAEPEPAAADELEQLQDTVTKRTCRLILMEQESAELGQQLGEMIGQASQLKIKISEGNAVAVLDLDASTQRRSRLNGIRKDYAFALSVCKRNCSRWCDVRASWLRSVMRSGKISS